MRLERLLDSLFLEGGFSPGNFEDLFYPVTIASFVFLVGTIVLYNVQTRRYRHHPPLVNLQEWLFWTGLSFFGLMLVYAVFKFFFIFVLITLVVGIGTMIWIRWFRFPPLIEFYNLQLRREQYLSHQKYASSDATIRSRTRPKQKPRSKTKKKRR